MDMSLTKNDLKAIENIVDKLIDESKQHTAAGLAELHGKFDNLKTDFTDLKVEITSIHNEIGEIHNELNGVTHIVQRIERMQLNEIDRTNRQEKTVAKIRKTLRAV